MSDLTPDDLALLESARDGLDASPSDHARVKRRLFAQIGVAVGVGTSAISASSGASAGAAGAAGVAAGGLGAGAGVGFAAKVVLAVAFVGAVGGGAVFVQSSRSPHVSRAQAAAANVTVATTAQAPAQPRGPLPVALPATQAPPTDGVATPTPDTADPLPATVPLAPPRAEARAGATTSRNIAPRVVENVAHERAPVTVFPEPTAERTAAANSPPPAVAQALLPPALPAEPPLPGARPGPSTVDAEAMLLRQADAAVKAGDPERALALVNDHAQKFPSGILVEEREAERVVVLCALGRTREARAAGSAFLRAHPRSPLVGRVRASCGGS